MKKFIHSITLASGLIIGCASFNAHAYQPKFGGQKIVELRNQGSARSINGVFMLQNTTKHTLIFAWDQRKMQKSHRFKLERNKVYLQPGQEMPIQFDGAVTTSGKHQVVFPFNIFDAKSKQKVGSFDVDMYLSVKGGMYQKSTYKKLFLDHRRKDPFMGRSFVTVPDRGQIPRAPRSRMKLPSMKQLLNVNRELIYKIPTTSGVKGQNRPIPRRPGPVVITRPIGGVITPVPIVVPFLEMENSYAKNLTNKALVTAQGKFSYKGMDNLLHPAFGWRVRAWRKKSGQWKKVAEDWIQSDGKWTLKFGQHSGRLKFQYVAFNRFFKPMDSSNDTYRWVGPERSSTGLSHAEGSWLADTSGGSVRGLGEIYNEGMTLWSKLYWSGNINPLRSNAIKVYFPNTSYDCGDGSGVPWSCASTNGTIWLIPTHASRFGVMTHELGHQINYEFWNNNRPPNSGGSHSLGSCYTPGLAMMEGFANFMVYWAHAGRNTDPNAGFDFRVENPSFACTTLNKNEAWVAANFWDLHDTRGDGSDNLWFIHKGAVPKIYLTGGKKNSMAHFHSQYRNSANASHRHIIDNIFKQNNIIP
jgi:hypothetical protein